MVIAFPCTLCGFQPPIRTHRLQSVVAHSKDDKKEIVLGGVIMKCTCCERNTVNPYYFNDDKRNPVCNTCNVERLSYSITQGANYWQKTLDKNMDREYHRRAKLSCMANLINTTPAANDLLCIVTEIKDKLVNTIKLHLEFYNRDDLVALCVLIKQTFRAGMDGASPNFWHCSTEYNVACTMIRYCYEIENFEGRMLDELEPDGTVNLITAVVLIRILLVLENNIEICRHVDYSQRTIEELLYEPIEWDASEKYFEEYVTSVRSDKPEDYCFVNPALEARLRSEQKDLKSIEKRAGKVIEQCFSFNLDTMMDMTSAPMREVLDVNKDGQDFFFRLVPESELYSKFEGIATPDIVDRVLDTFTLRKAPDSLSRLMTRGFYELRSIVRFSNQVFLAPLDLFQSASAFRSYALSGHFIDLYSLEKGTQSKLSAIMNCTSTFVVYTLVDVLMENGYTLPHEKKKIEGVSYITPMAEIKKVKKDGINLLNRDENLIDIDILACNESNKTVYNIEVKHYKPAVSVDQMMFGDQSKVEGNDTVRKTLARESLIRSEMETFLSFLGVQIKEGYKVKSFIVSSRPNYFSQLCYEVECISWRQFCERAENRAL